MVELRSSSEGLQSAIRPYLRALDGLDRHGALACAWGLVDAGHSPGAVVENVLVPAQVEVGLRWEIGLR